MKRTITKTAAMLLMLAAMLSLFPVRALAASAGSAAGTVTASGYLNVRSAASASSQILSVLPGGSSVTLISQSGGWWRVEYGAGRYGYCSAAYIAKVSGAYAAYATASLNVRSGPGTENAVTGWLNSGQYAVVLSSSGNWRRVLYNGTKTGYVSAKYLSTGTSHSAVSLSVPSYKQTDPRWAYVEVGVSGSTIGTIGCSTTALAMSESYRTKTTIYPNEMENRLKYTSGGGVYWPSNYSTYTGGDYLSFAYRLLQSGKPALIGLKTASGSQHWVVVTGFTGGASLSASGFTVNDPGTANRTTLRQVIDSYPYFYKLMYY